MRNLKKVLSLVLALAMVLSICMVGAGAVDYDNFTDKESITKAEAVATLVNLDVINGYNDGKEFRPQGNVTRAEMVTMICRVLAGGDNMIPNAVKEVPTYTDVRSNPSAAWAETYIEYCTSLGIVSGKGNGIFDPMADVTAAEAAKIVMTAVGYNADIEGFKGIGWDINTMAKASTLKLLENLVGEISANQPVTREQVAQLIYNAMSIPMVQSYNGNMANLWIGSGANAYQQTLLEKAFNAKKVTGVVIANEWASLLDTRPIDEGKTMLWLLDDEGDIAYEGDWSKLVSTKEFQNDTLTVNASTTLEQVGSSVTVLYKTDTRQNIFGIVMDSGLNNIVEFTKGGKLETRDLSFDTYTERDGVWSTRNNYGTQYFINYDDEAARLTASDYKIKYVIYTDTEAKAKAYQDANNGLGDVAGSGSDWTYTREIAPEREITRSDEANIRKIFYEADLTPGNTSTDRDEPVDGEVYVGTQSTKDVSDTMSWREFQRQYLNSTEVGNAYFNEIENGNYAKLVDCDNDGVAEFAFKIEYTLAEVASARERNGEVTYTFVNDSMETTGANADVDRVIAGDDLAKGDVVVYTIIDRIAYVDLADVVTATTKTINYRDDSITTTDGDTYEQSGIENDTDYAQWIAEMDEKVAYNMFLDKYGYVRAYRLVDEANHYGLLTEAYTTSEFNSQYVKNETGIVELKAGDARIQEYRVFNYSSRDKNIFFEGVNPARPQPGHYTNVLTYADNMLNVSGYYNDGVNDPYGYYSNSPHFTWTTGEKTYPSETNVGRYVLNEDGTVTLYSASKRATNKANEFLYYRFDTTTDVRYPGDDFTRYTEATWKSAYADAKNLDLKDRTDAATVDTAWSNAVKGNLDSDKTWNVQPVMAVDYVQLAIQSLAKGAWKYDIDNTDAQYDANNNRYINGVHDTEYYLVQNDKITYFTDYTRLPEIKAADVKAMYAVAENTNADKDGKDYWVANVVVIELTGWETGYDSVALAYNNNSKTSEIVRDLATLNAETSPKDIVLTPANKEWPNQWKEYGFYELMETEVDGSRMTAERIEKIVRGEFNDHHIYAGTVQRSVTVSSRGDYIVVDMGDDPIRRTDTQVKVRSGDVDVPVYVIRDDDRTGHRIDRYTAETAELDTGDEIIWVCNKKGDVSYIVLSVRPGDSKMSSYAWVKTDVWNEIMAEQNTSASSGTTDWVEKAKEIFAEGDFVNGNTVDNALTLLEQMTVKKNADTTTKKELDDIAAAEEILAPALEKGLEDYGKKTLGLDNTKDPGYDSALASLKTALSDGTKTFDEAKAELDARLETVKGTMAQTLQDNFDANDSNGLYGSYVSRYVAKLDAAIEEIEAAANYSEALAALHAGTKAIAPPITLDEDGVKSAISTATSTDGSYKWSNDVLPALSFDVDVTMSSAEGVETEAGSHSQNPTDVIVYLTGTPTVFERGENLTTDQKKALVNFWFGKTTSYDETAHADILDTILDFYNVEKFAIVWVQYDEGAGTWIQPILPLPENATFTWNARNYGADGSTIYELDLSGLNVEGDWVAYNSAWDTRFPT